MMIFGGRITSTQCVVKSRRGYISSNSSNGQEFPRMIYCISTLMSFGQFEYACVVWDHNLTASQSDKLYAETGATINSW